MSRELPDYSEFSDDHVQQMLLLAERLRANRGQLDEEAILAVAEATSAPVDYVRLALKMQEKRRGGARFGGLRAAMLEFDPATRRMIASAGVGLFCAMANVLGRLNYYSAGRDFFWGLGLLGLGVGLWNLSLAKEPKSAVSSGAILGASFFMVQALFAYVTGLPTGIPVGVLPAFLFGGALVGLGAEKIIERFRGRLGLKDPAVERQALLRQLVDLQDKLRAGEQSITFLSVDVVGSTRMKATADPLSIEFTFNEYHQFVENVAHKHGGRVHSTAGDGLTLAFDHPQQAFAAAKNLQVGIIELNTFRNKIGQPMVLRCGVHSGAVVAPRAGDIKSLNFAHVIDMAAHIQKECPPGGIAISADSASALPGGTRSVSEEVITVIDTEVYLWRPKSAIATLPNPTSAPTPGDVTLEAGS